ncbi:MAG: ABC transporter substrate-binding protein [Christensenellales bacterium]
MRNLKLYSLLLALLLAISLIAGCAPANETPPAGAETQQTAQDTAASTPDSTGGVTVKDAEGNDVFIEEAPVNIVALPLWQAEIVLSLIEADRIAAVSSYFDSGALSAASDKAAQVAGRAHSEAEVILGFWPDLVLLDTFNDPDGSLKKSLEEAGVTVLVLESPLDFEAIRENVKTIADALHASEKGEALISEMDAVLDGVLEKVGTIAGDEKAGVMYYEDYFDASGTSAGMLAAYGQGSPFNAICEAAGVINVCTAPDYSPISKEKVVAEWKPDVLIVPGIQFDENWTPVEDNGKAAKEAIENDEVMAGIEAVKQGRIYALSEQYRGSTSHYMAYAVKELAELCYPELFK